MLVLLLIRTCRVLLRSHGGSLQSLQDRELSLRKLKIAKLPHVDFKTWNMAVVCVLTV